MWSKVPAEPLWEYSPKNWQMIGKTNYYPHINEEKLAVVNAVRKELEDASYWDDFDDHKMENDNDEPTFLKILRFCRAQKWDLEKTVILIKKDIDWRRENNIFYIRNEYTNSVLTADYATQIFTFYPTWLQGFDKQGRPVAYKRFGNLDIAKILSVIDLQALLRFHAFEAEMTMRAANCSSRQNKCNIEQMTVVVDAAGWGMHLATSEALEFLKGVVAIDNAHYPERMGQMLVVNAPWTLSGVWSMISVLLDPVTKAKIQIISSESVWKRKLFEIVDCRHVPQSFGGDAPDLTPEEMALSFVIEGRSDSEKERITALVQRHRHKEHPETRKALSGVRKKKKRSNADPDGTGITHGMKRSWRERFMGLGLETKRKSDVVRANKLFSQKAVEKGGSGFFTELRANIGRGGSSSPTPDNIQTKYPKPRADGCVYEGGWKHHLYEGRGTLRMPNGSVYEGNFHKGEFHGRGSYIFTNMKSYQGRYGNRYEGCFKEGLFDDDTGRATLHYMGGMVYKGGFEKGLRHGQGELTYTDGKVIEGEFKDDHCSWGKASYLHHLQREHRVLGQLVECYEGELQQGKRHGKGTITFANREQLEGSFNMDELQTEQDELSSFLKDC